MFSKMREKNEWVNALLNEGYSQAGAKSAAKKIVKMDADIREALRAWMEEGVLEDMSVEDISVLDLVEKLGFGEIGAYLMLDWLRREPNAAKQALCEVDASLVISDNFLEEMEAAARLDDEAHAQEKLALDQAEAEESEEE